MSLAHEEHEEVAWEVAVKSRPLGVRTASLKWQMVSLGEPGGSQGSHTDQGAGVGAGGTLLVCFRIGASWELVLWVGGKESRMLPTAKP